MDGKSFDPIKRITTHYDSMTKAHKRISDLILGREDIGSYLTLNEFSDLANVTPVTMVKFCKAIGYDTFSDFRKHLQSYVQNMVFPRSVIKQDANLEVLKNSEMNLHTILASEEKLISDSFSLAGNYDNIIKSVNYIKNSKRVFFAAKGIALPVAQMFQIRFDFLSIDSSIIKMDNINILPRRILNCSEDDLFIIFSFPNYSKSLGELAESAKSLGCKVICITDKMSAPPCQHSDLVLLCQTLSTVFYNSMTVPVSLVNIISTLLTIELSDDLNQNAEKINQIKAFFNNKDL